MPVKVWMVYVFQRLMLCFEQIAMIEKPSIVLSWMVGAVVVAATIACVDWPSLCWGEKSENLKVKRPINSLTEYCRFSENNFEGAYTWSALPLHS